MPEIDLTAKEILGLMLESGLSATKADALAIWGAISALNDEGMLQALGLTLSVGGSPEAVAAAQVLSKRQTRRIWGDWLKAELNKVGQAVARGIEQGKGVRDIARTLNAVKGLDPQRAARYEKMRALLELSDRSDAEVEAMLDTFFKKELRARKTTIARTEARFATSDANRIIADDRGQKFKAWITVGDDRVSDIDETNQGEGWIAISEAFSSGDQNPPSHPNCRCSVTYRTAPPTDEAKRRVEARASKTAAAKEAA